jgi:hypothetical protein
MTRMGDIGALSREAKRRAILLITATLVAASLVAYALHRDTENQLHSDVSYTYGAKVYLTELFTKASGKLSIEDQCKTELTRRQNQRNFTFDFDKAMKGCVDEYYLLTG